MKKIISSILAVTAAMSIATVSYATTPITWSQMGASSTISTDLTTKEWHRNAKNTGTLASGVWSRLQEFSSGIGRLTLDGKAAMYDVTSGAVVTPEYDRLQVRCGWNEGNGTVWYGGGTKIKLTDKELKPGTQYKLTVKAGVKSNTGMMTGGTRLNASFYSANGTHDFRSNTIDILKDYDSRVEKGTAGVLGALATDQYTDAENNKYYKLNTYTLNLTPDASDYNYDGVYSGFTTLVLFAANRAEDGTWKPIMETGKMSELVIDSVSIEPVGNTEASTVIKRGVSQTFEKVADGTVSADRMGWVLGSDSKKTRISTRSTGEGLPVGGVTTKAEGSKWSLLLCNTTAKTDAASGEAVDVSATRPFSSYEIRPGEKYGLSFYARISLKTVGVPVSVSVGGQEVKLFSTAENFFGEATYAWKQFYCTFTAPAADSYTDGKINVAITAKSLSAPSSKGETDFLIDDVVLTAANQSFANDFNAAEGEDLVPFYANVYAGRDAINATLYPALFNEGSFIEVDTLRAFIVNANSVTTLSDSVSVNGGDTLKLMYWDGMCPVANFNQMLRPAAAAK